MSKGNGISTYTTEMLRKERNDANPESAAYPSNTQDKTRNAKYHLEGNGIITKNK